MNTAMRYLALCCLLWLPPHWADARPITFTGGQVWVTEAQADQWQWRYTYSHSFRHSSSIGGVYVNDLKEVGDLRLTYLRAAWLARRWNQPNSQGNLFVWGGLGQARTDLDTGVGRHVGVQADWETRRVYTSLVSELHDGRGWRFSQHTVSLGVAPFEHDYDRTAVWLVAKGMRSTGRVDDESKAALVVRWFNPRWWLEAGVDSNGKPLGFFMINVF